MAPTTSGIAPVATSESVAKLVVASMQVGAMALKKHAASSFGRTARLKKLLPLLNMMALSQSVVVSAMQMAH
jgi:hypothetical protein